MIGVDDAVNAIASITGKVIDRLWPDPLQAAQAKLELLKMTQSGELAKLAAETDLAKGQLAVNTAEATNRSLFTSGWRPFIGWVCGVGLGTQFIVRPFALWGGNIVGRAVDFPTLDVGTLMTLLFGMLGLGALRTTEKLQGVASK